MGNENCGFTMSPINRVRASGSHRILAGSVARHTGDQVEKDLNEEERNYDLRPMRSKSAMYLMSLRRSSKLGLDRKTGTSKE